MGCNLSNPCAEQLHRAKKRKAFQPVYEKELSLEEYGRRERTSEDSTSYTADKYVTPRDARRLLKRQERVVEAMQALQADAALKNQMFHPDGEMFGDALSGTGIYPFSPAKDGQSVRQTSTSLRRWHTSNVDALGRQVWPEIHSAPEHNWVRARDTMPGYAGFPGSPYQRTDVSPYGTYPGPGMMPQAMGGWGQRSGYATPGVYPQVPMINRHQSQPEPMYAQPIRSVGDPFDSTPVYHKQQESSNLDELLIQSILNDSENASAEPSTKDTSKSKDLAVPSSDKVTHDDKSAQEDEKGTTDKDVFAMDFFEPSTSRRTPSKDYNPYGVELSVSGMGEFNPFGINGKESQGELSSESSGAARRREIAREIDDIIS